jgi:hypothetical protein
MLFGGFGGLSTSPSPTARLIAWLAVGTSLLALIVWGVLFLFMTVSIFGLHG